MAMTVGVTPVMLGAAPMAVTVTLTDEIDVSRGDMLVHPDTLPCVGDTVEATVVWLAERPFVAGHSYLLKQTTRSVPAELAVLHHAVDVNTLARRPATSLAPGKSSKRRPPPAQVPSESPSKRR